MIDLRTAQEGDLTAIHALESEAFPTGWSVAAWAEECENHFVGIACSAEVVGVISMGLVAETAEVRRIIVAAALQGQGIGRTLLEYGCDWARCHGAAEVFLEVSAGNSAAIALYESSGFEHLHTRPNYYGLGDDALVYRKEA